jgi:hypothetical protein
MLRPVVARLRVALNFQRDIAEREANSNLKKALYHPKVAARQVSAAANGRIAIPIQLKRIQNYLLCVPKT